jgi:hypothetical protein
MEYPDDPQPDRSGRLPITAAIIRVSRWIVPALLAVFAQSAWPDDCENRLVDVDELRRVIAFIDGYDITATTNQGRFVADVLLRLAAGFSAHDPDGPPFEIAPEDFFNAVVSVAGIEPEQMPVGFRRAREVGQVFVVDYRQARLIEGGASAGEVEQALAVSVRWPDDGPDHYEFEDTRASPSILVRYQREVDYRLIRLSDRVLYDAVEGLSGRPTSGALGTLFRVLGRAQIQSSHFALADDQTLVAYSRGQRLFPFSVLTTVKSDGSTSRGVPDDRDDLQALAERLAALPDLHYSGSPPEPCLLLP